MELLEIWRWINIIGAVSVVPVLWVRKARHDFKAFPMDIQFSALALHVWPLCYAFATAIADLSGNRPGVWTIIMSIPIFWMWLGAMTHRDLQNGTSSGWLTKFMVKVTSRREQSL